MTALFREHDKDNDSAFLAESLSLSQMMKLFFKYFKISVEGRDAAYS